MAEESKSDQQFAKGWSLFVVPIKIQAFLREPPTWFSAPIFVLCGAVALCIVGFLAWLLIAFVSAVEALNSFAVKGTKPETADALKHLIGASGGVIGGLIATSLVVWRTILTQKQTFIQNIQKDISEQIHFATVISKSMEQLGAMREEKDKLSQIDENGNKREREYIRSVPNIPIRVGAIFLLERIIRDSPNDRNRIIETLANYVSDRAGESPEVDPRKAKENQFNQLPPTGPDVVSAMKVIGKNPISIKSSLFLEPIRIKNIFLNNCSFVGLDFSEVDFFEANFMGCNFFNCKFNSTNFLGASFFVCKFTDCDFSESNMDYMKFKMTNFKNCSFQKSRLYKTNTEGISAQGCDFRLVKELTPDQFSFIKADADCKFI